MLGAGRDRWRMSYSEIILALIIILLLVIMRRGESERAKERKLFLESIDRLQNKLMARDFTEYANQTRQTGQKKVSNPLMDKVNKNMQERNVQPEESEEKANE